MIINSVDMTLELPVEKRLKIKNMLSRLLSSKKLSVQDLAESIGVLVAACPAVAYGWLYYKELELVKRNALNLFKNNPNNFT